MKTILLTGSTGFIGSNLIGKLKEIYKVIQFDRAHGKDITKKEDFKNLKTDIVIHLAAAIYPDNPEIDNVNINGLKNVLSFCKENKSKLIFISTAAVYGLAQSPIKESSKTNPVNKYGQSKLDGENLSIQAGKEADFPVIILRIFNAYGPNQDQGLFIPSMLRKIEQEEITVENPSAERDFVHVDDVTDAIISSLSLESSEIINIGSGKGTKIIDLVKMIAGTKKVIPIEKQGRTGSIYADISKAKSILGWQPKITLEEGLKRLIKADL